MGYAENVIRQLLFEEVAQDKVALAIRKRHEVSFKYDSNDGDPRGKLERITVQPVTLGTTKAGNPCFRAYQVNGSSESAEKREGQIPGWRLFLLDRVVPNTWKDSGKVFKEPPMFNPEGDKTMAEVLVQADFKGSKERYQRGGLEKYNMARHERNVTNNPYYDFEKQLKNKKMAPDFVQRNIARDETPSDVRAAQWKQAQAELLKGNQRSINDMSRQKDFGDDEQTETTGPIKKGVKSNATASPSTKSPNYSRAQMNGPMYKSQVNNVENNIENDEFEQHSGEGTEDDAR